MNTLRAGFMMVACSMAFGSSAVGEMINLDFEDGTGHNNLLPSEHYAGLTISNGVWIDPSQSFGTFGAGDFALGVDDGWFGTDPENNWAYPSEASPIVITFDGIASEFSIQAFDVGVSGALIEAFDSSGNSLGTVSDVGAGIGSGNHPVLSISAAGIKSVHLRQVVLNSNDGLGWDNLSAEVLTVPEPSSLALFGMGSLSLIGYRRRRKKLEISS